MFSPANSNLGKRPQIRHQQSTELLLAMQKKKSYSFVLGVTSIFGVVHLEIFHSLDVYFQVVN
jgi:hypothetical protein